MPPTTETIQAALFEQAKNAILNFDVAATPEIYAISFWINAIDDDPRKVNAVVGYNTLSRFEESKVTASDEGEAKWNFAFWLQNEETVLGGNDPAFQVWVQSLDCYHTDEEVAENFENCLERMEQIHAAFVETMIGIAQRLHADGVIRQQFNRNIPIIIHELEYYDKPLEWTKQANPEGLANEFEQWVLSLCQ